MAYYVILNILKVMLSHGVEGMYVLIWTSGCESIVILTVFYLEMVDIPLKYRSNKQYIDHNHHRALKLKTV